MAPNLTTVPTIRAETALVPLNRLRPHPGNARRTGQDRGVPALAASILAHGLLHPLLVEPERDGEGKDTGHWLVVAGERRRRALLLLAKRGELPRHARVECRVRGGEGQAAEASLAENHQREAMHPLDEAEAFAALVAAGDTAAAVAHRHGLSEGCVLRRLRLAALEPSLAALFRAGELSLAQAQALTFAPDPAAQRQAWDALGWNREPEAIRRLLTQGRVPTHDRRVLFVGLDAYQGAGGTVTRDLFGADGEGWLDDALLLERLALEGLEREAAAVRAEGWGWVLAAVDHPHALAASLRRLAPAGEVAPTPEELGARALLDGLMREWDGRDVPDTVAAEMDGLTRAVTEYAAQRRRYPDAWAPRQRPGAGAIVSLAHDGTVRVERGYVRPEDDGPDGGGGARARPGPGGEVVLHPRARDKGPRPLPERLVARLTAERTAALAWHLQADTDAALLALAHALALPLLYGDAWGSCLNLEVSPPRLEEEHPGIADSPAGKALALARGRWAALLPRDGGGLWAWLLGQDAATVRGLLGLCAGLLADAVQSRHDGAERPADRAARLVGLDMAHWWEATPDSYLAHVPKARVLEAVVEAKGPREAAHIASLKRDAMATRAARLLAGTGWLPAPLRLPEPEAAEPAPPAARAAE